MDSEQFINEHNGIVLTALIDYQRWFDEDEAQFEEIRKAIEDLNLIGGESV